MRKRIIAALAAAALLLTSSGCVFFENEISDLFQPPRLGQEQQAVLDSLSSVAGSEYTLKHPHSGTNRSSVIFADFDGDGENEAAAFFIISNMDTVRLQFFDNEGGKWMPKEMISGDCNEIYQYELADLDGNGSSELVVGWDISLTSDPQTLSAASGVSAKGLCVYSCSEGVYRQIFTTPYTHMLKVNLNSDTSDEIAVIATSYARIENAPTASDAEQTPEPDVVPVLTTSLSLIEINSSVISAKRSVKLPSGVSAYNNIVSGKIGDGKPAIFLDARLNDGGYLTQIIQLLGDDLVTLFSDDDNPTRRANAVYCMDIDHDTITEFPVCTPLPDYSNDSPTVRYLTDWCTFENGEFTTSLSSIISTSYGFYITVYGSHRSRLTVEVIPEQTLYTVRLANGHLTGDVLFSIKRFSESERSTLSSEGYSILFSTGGYIIAASIPAELPNGYDIDLPYIADIVHPISFS